MRVLKLNRLFRSSPSPKIFLPLLQRMRQVCFSPSFCVFSASPKENSHLPVYFSSSPGVRSRTSWILSSAGASSPGSASKTAPGTPPLDTQGFSAPTGIFDKTRAAAKAATESGTELLEDAQSWVESATAGMTSFTAESREFLGVVETEEAAIDEQALKAGASIKEAASDTVHQVEDSVAAAVADMQDASAAAAESAGTGHLKQVEDSVAEVISAADNKVSAMVDAVADTESKAAAAAQSMGSHSADVVEDALEQVEASSDTIQSEATKAKGTLASVVSPTDIKAAANAAMRASSVMEHLAQRSVSSMSSVKSKVNAAVVWLLVP